MCFEQEPRAAGQKLAELERLSEPQLGDDPDFYGNWLGWERDLQDSERVLGAVPLSEPLKVAIVRRRAPQQLRTHLELHAQEYEEDHLVGPAGLICV